MTVAPADVLAAAEVLLQVETTYAPVPRIPDFGFGDTQSGGEGAIQRFLGYAQGVVVVLGVIGVLYSAGKMAAGRLGRSEVAAEGVGGLVWTIMGVSLMLLAIPIATTLTGAE
ncbi:hypothetical protein [Nocardiopsis potens]|uniref:hypothetical protein n=1 Tax=Nocardiopsis potens TaxID=1246458 RepID=UPI000345014C|nr:hypothetical protein [Nocardiopsis potens]